MVRSSLCASTQIIAMNVGTEYYQHHRPEVAKLLPLHYSRVLEIGCGEGRFRPHLTQPCEYMGVEPSPAAAAIASGSLDRVITGTFESAAELLPANYFDLVICNDVIEHMVDHDRFLNDIQRHMAPGAFLVGSVPNVRYIFNLWDLLVRKDWRYMDHGVLDRTHLRFFTQKSWRASLLAHHFSIEALHGINEPSWGSRLLRRWAKLSMAALVGSDSKFLQIGFRAKRG